MKSLRFLTLAVVIGFAATASAQAQQPFEP